MDVHQQVEQFLAETLENTDCYVVSFKVKPTNNYKIYIDSDTGFTLEKSVRIHRQIRRAIEESGIYPDGDYSIEVSSPGVDEPLCLHRQYVKNIGRKLEIELKDEASKGITGRLIEVDDKKIVLEQTLPSKKKSVKDAAVERIEVELNEIKKATVAIEF